MNKRKAIIIVVTVIFIKLLITIIMNRILISNYSNNNYSESIAKILENTYMIEKYKSHYNYGNILYQKGQYDDAIKEYQKALKKRVPKYKECDIRVNYALAICNTVNIDEEDQDSIKEGIQKYLFAVEVLIEDGCAGKGENSGHDAEATTLKQDILKEIARLLVKTSNSKTKDEPNNKKEQNNVNKSKEEKINELKNNSLKEQRKTESVYNNLGKFNEFLNRDRNEVIW